MFEHDLFRKPVPTFRDHALAARIAPDDGQDLAGDVARATGRSEEHEGRRDFFRLRRPLHRRIGTEFGDSLGRFVGRIQWRPVPFENLIREDSPELWNRGMLAGDGCDPQAADRGATQLYYVARAA